MADIQTLPITAITIGDRVRQDLGDIESLARSIREDGLLHPPVVTTDGLLIAGRRRLEAMRFLGFKEIPVRILNPADLRRAEAAENGLRKSLRPSEMYALAIALMAIERLGGEALDENDPVRLRDRLGKYLGLGGRTTAKLLDLGAAAARGPEWKVFLDEADSIGKIDGPYRKLRELEEQRGISKAAATAAPHPATIAVPAMHSPQPVTKGLLSPPAQAPPKQAPAPQAPTPSDLIERLGYELRSVAQKFCAENKLQPHQITDAYVAALATTLHRLSAGLSDLEDRIVMLEGAVFDPHGESDP